MTNPHDATATQLPIDGSTTAKPVAKKAVAKKPAAAATKSPAATKTTVKKAVAKKPVAKKAVTRKPAPRKPAPSRSTTSARVKAASASLGEQVYKRVEEVVATGTTAKDAFAVVAKERRTSVSNVQQHYYRFKRKAQTSGSKANASTRSTVKRLQGGALAAATVAVGKIPAKQRAQAAHGVSAVTRRAQHVSTVGTDVREDLTKVVEDLLGSANGLLAAARRNPRVHKAEQLITARFTR